MGGWPHDLINLELGEGIQALRVTDGWGCGQGWPPLLDPLCGPSLCGTGVSRVPRLCLPADWF